MTLAELKAALCLYTQRSDAASRLEVLLPVAEQRIYNGEADTPGLRISAMLKTGTTLALPADWLAMARVTAGRGALEFSPYEQFASYANLSGVPSLYSIHGGVLSLAPTSVGQTVEYSYYARFPSLDLADPASTNWLTTNAPSVYLNALLVEFARASQDDVLLVKEVGNYKSTVAALMSSDKAAQISGRTLRRGSGMSMGLGR